MADSIKAMIDRGQDPKDLLIETCQPECKYWKDKLTRCENAMKALVASDPEKTCMYPLRDYVTCTESCVQPKIFKHLKGNESGWYS
mmetsp:Transcript_12867/g.10994  ORF Transcript_12867/g.10994 Transcript_12867/m.10994 type:complete len:86 (-) Transcript_12867:54-311(-)